MRTGAMTVADMRAARLCRQGGFSLVELLTVIFIIALLIGILIPSLGKARDAAKKVSTAKGLDSIKVGLEMFKNENGSEFPQTNGYPPSFAHPPLSSFGNYTFDPLQGEYPFHPDDAKPQIYGAQWLPAILMGPDAQGYIKRSAVPKSQTPLQPPQWYKPDAVPDRPIDRSPLYVTTENAPTKKSREIAGRRPDDFFEDWNDMQDMPVFVDGWDQAILYYASNSAGRATNMVEDERDSENNYGNSNQSKGPPFYFHQDNEGFTGKDGRAGWDFGISAGKHAIARAGEDLTAPELLEADNRDTFAHYIVDRKVYAHIRGVKESGTGSVPPETPLRPVNADTYLLISPGVDGIYGTTDDVSNIPAFDQ